MEVLSIGRLHILQRGYRLLISHAYSQFIASLSLTICMDQFPVKFDRELRGNFHQSPFGL
jgi:hypothetical protein